MNITKTRNKQSILGSLFESLIAALIAAPSAMALHWYMLDLWSNDMTEPEIKSHFITISWVSFFLHSIIWKFILRRLFERYQWLDPKIWLKSYIQKS